MLKKKKNISYVSKHNSRLEKQVTFLITPNGEIWHYTVVEKISVLLREMTLHCCNAFWRH